MKDADRDTVTRKANVRHRVNVDIGLQLRPGIHVPLGTLVNEKDFDPEDWASLHEKGWILEEEIPAPGDGEKKPKE